MVKVKLLGRVAGLGEEGDIVEVPYKRAGQLIETHYAEEAKAGAAKKKTPAKK